MKNNRPPFRTAIGTGFKAFYAALPQIAVFEIVYKLASALVTKPLLSVLTQILLQIGGNQLAFNEKIWHFIFSLPGILAVVLLVGLASLLIYFEFAVIITLAQQALQQEKPSLKNAIPKALWCFGSIKSPSALLFALYALLLLPLVNMGITSSLLPALTVPNFITGELAKTPVGEWALLAAAALVVVVFFCLLFVLPAMVIEHRRFGPAAQKSLGAIRSYGFSILGILLVFGAAWVVLFKLPRLLFNFFFGVPSIGIFQAISYLGLSFRTPVVLFIWLVATAAQYALMPLLLTILTACYLPVATPAQPNPQTLQVLSAWLQKWTGRLQTLLLRLWAFIKTMYGKLMRTSFMQKHKKLVAILLAVLLIFAVYGAFFTSVGLHDPIVIGHRGSAYGVENTLEAIQQAINAGANYAEVDILLSADGVPMVIHDTNLKRLSGQNVNVYDLTAEQLQAIALTQNGYTGHIPTLQEAIAFCEGKILLAVELKLHGHEQTDLVTAVMQEIKQSRYQKDCLFLSLDYNLVAQVKQQYKNYKAGYCVYGNIGQLTPQNLLGMEIDFLLVEEWMVNANLLATCRKAWLPVYVWTVNNPEKMQDYLQMGVVGLVTDYPDAAVELLGTMYNLAAAQPVGAKSCRVS